MFNTKNLDFIGVFHVFHIVINIFVCNNVWNLLKKALYKEYKIFLKSSANLIK